MSYDSLNCIFFLSKLLFNLCGAGGGWGVRLGERSPSIEPKNQKHPLDVPGGAVDKNPLASAGGRV